MDRIHAGTAPIASLKGKRIGHMDIIKVDDSYYEDTDALIMSFYEYPAWHDIKGEICAIDKGGRYKYTRDGKVYDGRDSFDIMVWTVIDDCECGNEDTRNEQDEKGLPMDEPICAWHSYQFNWTSVEYACKY